MLIVENILFDTNTEREIIKDAESWQSVFMIIGKNTDDLKVVNKLFNGSKERFNLAEIYHLIRMWQLVEDELQNQIVMFSEIAEGKKSLVKNKIVADEKRFSEQMKKVKEDGIQTVKRLLKLLRFASFCVKESPLPETDLSERDLNNLHQLEDCELVIRR